MPPLTPTTTVLPSSGIVLARFRGRRLALGEPHQLRDRDVLAREEDPGHGDVDHHLDHPGEQRIADRRVLRDGEEAERENTSGLPGPTKPGACGRKTKAATTTTT